MDARSLKSQFAEILAFFPNSRTIDDHMVEIPLFPEASITLSCKKYPKKPKIKIPKNAKKILGDIESFIPSLRYWDQSKPASLKNILFYIQAAGETLTGHLVHISEKIIEDISHIAKAAAPKEMFCLLRMVNGILHEYVMAPGMEASELTAVFFPNRLNQDSTLVASCHSHPSGNTHPSEADLQTFKKKPINIIIGAPYDITHLGVYNHRGELIQFQLNSVNFTDSENPSSN